MTTPTLRETLPVWAKIGLLSFGGPASQIALMQDEVVTKRGWVPPESFDRGLSFSMMLPGPEAQQLATWLGWRLHGTGGGMIAGLSFILPGAALMIVLAWLAAAYGEVPLIAALFGGIQPVVIALVLAAMAKIAGRALKSPLHWVIAGVAFAALYLLGVPFPVRCPKAPTGTSTRTSTIASRARTPARARPWSFSLLTTASPRISCGKQPWTWPCPLRRSMARRHTQRGSPAR